MRKLTNVELWDSRLTNGHINKGMIM